MLMAALFVASTALGQVDANRVVATVNGEEIRGAEYYRRMEFLPGVGRFSGNRFAEMPPGFMTLDQLITERLILQLARKKGVFPTDLEVQQEVTFRTQDNPNFIKQTEEAGLTREDVNHQIRVDLAQFKLATFGVNVTDQEVEQQYRTQPARYTVPKRLKLRLIAVATDEAVRTVDADLAANKPFADVARTRSEDVSKPIGGDMGWVPVDALPSQVRAVVDPLKIGSSSAWIKQGTANVKYYLEDVRAEEKLQLTPALRRSIRREMMLQRGSVRNDIKKEMRDLRRQAAVDIKQKEFADAYRKFIEAYLKEGGG